MDIQPAGPAQPGRIWAAAMWLATALFALRVAGQAIQRWLPQSWLPPFAEWQGSSISYPMLLAFQYLILGAMALTAYGAWIGGTRITRLRARGAAWLGGIYLTASVARISIGALMPEAPAWFSAHISGAFHVVLALFLLAFAMYQSERLSISNGGVR